MFSPHRMCSLVRLGKKKRRGRMSTVWWKHTARGFAGLLVLEVCHTLRVVTGDPGHVTDAHGAGSHN